MDAIGLNLKYIVTNSIYAMDGYHAILGVSIKEPGGISHHPLGLKEDYQN